jgi:hypothetical protein
MESDVSSLRYINALSNKGLSHTFRTWIFTSSFDVVDGEELTLLVRCISNLLLDISCCSYISHF